MLLLDFLEVTADTSYTYLMQPSYDKQYEKHLWTWMMGQQHF